VRRCQCRRVAQVGTKLGAPGAIAQLGERLLCKQEVTGSIPVGSITGPFAGLLSPGVMEVPGRGEDREVADLQGFCVSDDRLAGHAGGHRESLALNHLQIGTFHRPTRLRTREERGYAV
jgi:hypothetical protein